ncbi:hypothetical protein [Clostridium sp. LIBA-8841]|uniref:hypothetical protein n=1 Tax=Clostridium sp. LIBA-8841 TaxID=2987530 RepID=UPI002AC3A2E1|nr:hypothetical protein [Clostridium sp. LIBA-8841]MDZ5255190.1 hypothetical protein [Clostridium sp. LIBA-8841]
MWLFEKLMFLWDLVDGIKDIYETWKEKDVKILSKIICMIITLIFIFISIKIWV